MPNLVELLSIALEASLAAGKKILEVYNSDDFDVEIKSDKSPLTSADRNAHDEIMSYLSYTSIPVLSEEGAKIPYADRKDWEYLWIVDPLDGTKEFIKRNGEFTVNIALIHLGKPVLGVIYTPVLDVLYFGNQEIGSYKSTAASSRGDIARLLEHSHRLPLPNDSTSFGVVVSRSHMNEETAAFLAELKSTHPNIETVSSGSSLKFCLVAEGTAKCYPRFGPTMEWDTAAGQAICEFAGCHVTVGRTNEILAYNRENLLNPHFIVQSQD